MSGRHAFSELTKDYRPERRKRIDARKLELREAAAQTCDELSGDNNCGEPGSDERIPAKQTNEIL